MKIKILLTSTQQSALDCAGIFETPEGRGEEILRDGIQGQTLTIEGREDIGDAASAARKLSDLEDERAEQPGRDAEQREGDRKASRALQTLASKLWKAESQVSGEVL